MGSVYSFPRRRTELDQLVALRVSCDDCGRGKRWTGLQIAQFQERGCRSLEDVAARLVCSCCAERGGSGKNLDFAPTWRGTRKGERL